MSDIQIYKQIDGLQSVVQQLVENIYTDESYQEYLKDLEGNDSKASTKKAVAIKSIYKDIKVFGNNTQPLFLANEIGTIIGASNVSTMIKNYTDTEKITGVVIEKGKMVKKTFLTKHGVYRIIFNNRSKLSEVFRGFIYKLIDHMFSNEIIMLKKIINDFTNENPELVRESILELEDNIQKYKRLYDEEKTTRIDLESEIQFSEMYISQLKMEKQHMLSRLDDRCYEENLGETNTILDIFKKKYLKEFNIFLVNPAIIEPIFSDETGNYSDLELNVFREYKNEYNLVQGAFEHTELISFNEVFYFSLSYGSNKDQKDQKDQIVKEKTLRTSKSMIKLSKPKKEKNDDSDDSSENKTDKIDKDAFIKVMSEYTYDRNKFNELISILKDECDNYQISKGKKSVQNYIFCTNLEHIQLIARNLLLSHS